KFVHFGGGVVAAVFPWAFSTHWTVLGLGALMRATFVVARRAGLLASVTAVERRSTGELWYPVGVYLLFVIARHQPVFWLIALSSRPAESIALERAAELAMLLVALVLAWRTRVLSWAAAIAAHLAIYAAFSLGGPAWSVAPALALAGFVTLDARSGRRGGRHQVQAVFWVSIVGVVLIFLDNTFATLLPGQHRLSVGHPFVVPDVGALAAPAAIVAYQFLRLARAAWSRAATIAAAAGAGWALVAPLGLAALGRSADVR